MIPNKHALARMNKRKKGFTLTEIAIVLGIIGLILGAIWTAAAAVYANQRVAHANTVLLQTAQGVRTLYASQGSMEAANEKTDISAALTTAGAVPSDLGTADPFVGPFPGGNTAVYETSDAAGFMIVMSGLSQSACINMLTAIGGLTRDPGLFNADAVASAAPAVSDVGATGTPLATAITPAIAAAALTGTALTSGQGNCVKPLNKIRAGFTIK